MAARHGTASNGEEQWHRDAGSSQDRKDGLLPVVKFLQSSLAMKSKVSLESEGSCCIGCVVRCTSVAGSAAFRAVSHFNPSLVLRAALRASLGAKSPSQGYSRIYCCTPYSLLRHLKQALGATLKAIIGAYSYRTLGSNR